MRHTDKGMPPVPSYVQAVMDEVGVTRAELTEFKLDYGPHHSLAERISIHTTYSTWCFEAREYDKNGLPKFTLWHESHRAA